MVDYIKVNFKVLFKYFIAICGIIFTPIEAVSIFIGFEDFGITELSKKLWILAGVLLIPIAFSLLFVTFRNKKKLFGDINKGLSIQYGDLMKIGFPTKRKKKKIVVIHVNRCFDVSCENNLIRDNSVHGQWLQRFIKNEEERLELNNYIQHNLEERKVEYELLDRQVKKEGNLKRYPEGTVVEIQGDNEVTFYLLALSNFDKNLKPNCSEIEFYNAMSGLIHYYDNNGNGSELFCPIMGDNLVIPQRQTVDIIDFMISTFVFNKENIRGKINLVVYNKMKSQISILNY